MPTSQTPTLLCPTCKGMGLNHRGKPCSTCAGNKRVTPEVFKATYRGNEGTASDTIVIALFVILVAILLWFLSQVVIY